jgi:hypothetical protein
MPAINLRATKGGRNMTPVSRRQKLHSVGRLLKYVTKYYPWQFVIVLLCVILSSSTGAIGAYIIGNVIVDSYINPAVKSGLALDSFAPATGFFAGKPFFDLSYCLGRRVSPRPGGHLRLQRPDGHHRPGRAKEDSR